MRVQSERPPPPDLTTDHQVGHLDHQFGYLRLEPSRRRVTLGGGAVRLSSSQYDLLATLLSRPDEVLSRHELAQLAWGYTHVDGSRSVDMEISRLRAKLNTGAAPAPQIISVRGRGYKLVYDP